MNLADLKGRPNQTGADPCDHRHLNEDVAFLREKIPSTESFVIAFRSAILPLIEAVRLFDTPRNLVEYFGEKTLPAS